MSEREATIFSLIQSCCSEVILNEGSGSFSIQVPSEKLVFVMEHLKKSESLAFVMLLDHLAVDWKEMGEFELVYQLYSFKLDQRIEVTTKIPRAIPNAHSVSRIWPIAEWQEREVYDLFGIYYINHPDLRRLFLEDDWKGFPLRKDYEDPFMLELVKE